MTDIMSDAEWDARIEATERVYDEWHQEQHRLGTCDIHRDPEPSCEAVTRHGAKCKMDRIYGRFCGLHYSILEKNINHVTTGVVNGRTIALARHMDRFGIPVTLPSGKVQAILHDLHVSVPEPAIRDAIMYRREKAGDLHPSS